MTRWEFMRELEELLSDIAPSEREEALQYYNDYLNDAGKENEQETLKELGSPREVAATVKEGLGISAEEVTGKTTEKTGQEENTTQKDGFAYDNKGSQVLPVYHKDEKTKKDSIPAWGVILIVVGCIILLPVAIPVVGSILAVIFGILAAIICIIFAFGIAAIALGVAAFIILAAGFTTIFVSPVLGIALLGASLICMALAVAFLLLTVFLCGVAIPSMCKGISYLWKKIFAKKEGK